MVYVPVTTALPAISHSKVFIKEFSFLNTIIRKVLKITIKA